MSRTVVKRVSVFPLHIPLRRKVTHAAAQRTVADPVVVAVELEGGIAGYGETHPRPYVTGETPESVAAAVETVFAPALSDFRPTSFPEALEGIEALAWRDTFGCPIPAARAAVELALLDAVMLAYEREIEGVVQWMGLPGFGSPGSRPHIRFSGVLASDDPKSASRLLRMMYWGGLRAFKLEVGVEGDREIAERVGSFLRRPIKRGHATLRIDAHGRWSEGEAVDWLNAMSHLPLAAIEQPLARGEEERLPDVVTRCGLRGTLAAIVAEAGDATSAAERLLMHDESVITIEDARRLIELGVGGGFNIRISKCGGLIPSLRLAALARRANVLVQLGCMAGETGILSAAGLRFLEMCPNVVWAEGCFGSWLLTDDVVTRGLRFESGGRPPRLRGPGLGVQVDRRRLEPYCTARPIVLNL